MKKAHKTKWVKALRSGRYKQNTDGLLLNDGSYCCLGVLALTLGAKFKTKGNEWDAVTVPVLDGEEIGQKKMRDGFLQQKVCGIPHPTQKKLANMNDDGKSFAEIADYIEANL